MIAHQEASRVRTFEEPSRGSQYWKAVRKFTRTKPLGAFGAGIVLLLLFAGIFAPWLTQYGHLQHSSDILQGPSWSHLAGTDQFGRDVFTRLLYGARISVYVGTIVTVVSMVPATILGIASAYFGGSVDYVLQRIVDTIQAVPYLILLIAIMVILGPSLLNVIIALSFRRAIVESRIMRGATLGVHNEGYIDAARSLGATDLHIMARYVLPNIMPTIIVIASLGFSGVILAEASLSFLGYGVPPPAPSWGGMLASDGRAYMFAAPWMLIAPTIALGFVVFGVNMFGDALRDVLDPRQRGTR